MEVAVLEREPDDWSDLEVYDERLFKDAPAQELDYFISIRKAD